MMYQRTLFLDLWDICLWVKKESLFSKWEYPTKISRTASLLQIYTSRNENNQKNEKSDHFKGDFRRGAKTSKWTR